MIKQLHRLPDFFLGEIVLHARLRVRNLPLSSTCFYSSRMRRGENHQSKNSRKINYICLSRNIPVINFQSHRGGGFSGALIRRFLNSTTIQKRVRKRFVLDPDLIRKKFFSAMKSFSNGASIPREHMEEPVTKRKQLV